MKQYDFNNLEKIKKVLDSHIVINNLRCRMESIQKIISCKEELNIQEEYLDIMYNQYLDLEKELVSHLRLFYKNVYDSLDKYDIKFESLFKQEEK